MKEPRWLPKDLILAVHNRQLAEHGGARGVRDEGLLESALARPLNLFAYGDGDVVALAAAYTYGLARNHPFIDGNKRTAFVACELFLMANAHELIASDEECLAIMWALAASEIDEVEFAAWLRENVQAR
ncbi:MAG: type II toxin-antitoxin system death-on-curing family toxin [Caulobacterales bacterium]|jgi:death-on-curing protein|nr:type II toxin-antitoxin system death-on-curing family toxin [Caulobacterales bacterium]